MGVAAEHRRGGSDGLVEPFLPGLGVDRGGAVEVAVLERQRDRSARGSRGSPRCPASHPAGTIVTAGHPGLVDTVLVAGRVIKRDGMLVDVDLPALRTRLFESRNRIAAAAGIPLEGIWRPRPES
jgi:hypothetical protein